MGTEDIGQIVRSQIQASFGDTSDLSEELVNTLCNLFYFAEKSRKLNMGGLTDLQKFHSNKNKNKEVVLKLYMQHMSHVAASVESAPSLVDAMRQAQREDPSMISYLEQLTLDVLKYSIKGAERKSLIRRSIERRFKTPQEYMNLADKFTVPFRGRERPGAPQKANSEQGKGQFAFSPSLPNVAAKQPDGTYEFGKYLVLFHRNLVPIGAGHLPAAATLKYPIVLTAVDTTTKQPAYIVTLETGFTAGYFLCGFTPDGGHHNFGDGSQLVNEQLFVNKAFTILREKLGVTTPAKLLKPK